MPKKMEAIGEREYSALMAPLMRRSAGPNQNNTSPAIAVAVSGGADSLALTLLTARWAGRRGRDLVALTVDHRLRKGSAAEAAKVGGWLKARGVEHHVLRRPGPRPKANIQAVAREARYDLMGTWCRRRGIGRLLLAQHQDDQAETVLLRLFRGSGVDGLSAMSALSERNGLDLLRPLLEIPKPRLEATCRKFGQSWIDDPSNRDEAFERVRVRRLLAEFSGDGPASARLAGTASHMSRVRDALDRATSDLLGRAVESDSGFAVRFVPEALAAAPREIALRALSRILRCVGGGEYPARFASLERLLDGVINGDVGGGGTLAGCRLISQPDGLLAVRENRGVEVLAIRPGNRDLLWDGRFRVGLARRKSVSSGKYEVRALGAEGWRQIRAANPDIAAAAVRHGLNAPVRGTLPALWKGPDLLAAPQLGFARRAAGKAFSACFEAKITLRQLD